MAMLGSGSGLEQASHDPGEQQEDRNEEKKVPFSISAILSEEVGRKKPHISSASSSSQERQQVSEVSPSVWEQASLASVWAVGGLWR